jgi:hypothetical protein
MLFVNEPGLYTLVLGSRKPEAKAFKRWITHEVIPAIRKTGGYLAKDMTPGEFLLFMAQRNLEAERRLAEHDQRLSDIETRQTGIEKGAEYFTIIGYARRIGRHVTNNRAQTLGKNAASYSRDHDYPIGEAPDPRHGKVNTYHVDVLKAVFGAKD